MDREKISAAEWFKKVIGIENPPKKSLKVILKSVGNPDYRQYAPISDPETVFCSTIEECSNAAMEYGHKWDMGGGNWPETRIWYVWLNEITNTVQKKAVALISPNGRVWTTEKDWKKRLEIIS